MMGYDPNAFGFFRQNDEGTLLGNEHNIGGRYGMMTPEDPSVASNRFDRFEGNPQSTDNQFQAGDVFNTRGMAPPPPREGGSWRFAGSSSGTMGKGMPGYGGDDSMPSYEQSSWIYEPTQQQHAAAPEQRRDQVQPQFVPPALDIYDETPEGWDRYRNIGRAEAEGLNRMPFTFAGTDAAYIPTDKMNAFEMFYPEHMQGYQNMFRNPLLESDTPPMSMTETGVSKAGANDPFLTRPYTNPLFRG